MYDSVKERRFIIPKKLLHVIEFYEDWNKLKLLDNQVTSFYYIIRGLLFFNLHYKGATRTRPTRRLACNLQFTHSVFIGSHARNWFDFWSKSKRFLGSTRKGFLIKDPKWPTSD